MPSRHSFFNDTARFSPALPALPPEAYRLAYLGVLAIVTGVVCGFIAIGFRYLIFAVSDLFFVTGASLINSIVPIYIIFFPAIGGIIVGLLTTYLANEAKGHGVPEVIYASEVRGGKMRPRIVAVKAIASAVTIGSGGSAGREGPIVQMGAAIGSSIAQRLNLTAYQTRVLLACGAAGGIAAAFNTPIAGVLFALELVIREVRTKSFLPIVTASVFATLISRTLLASLGAETAFIFEIPEYTLKTPWELGFYLLLGLVAGLVALLFIKTLYGIEDAFERFAIPEPLKPAIGGLIVGILGFFILVITNDVHIFGNGYQTMENMLDGSIMLPVVFALIFLKIIATSFSIGSGGSGGIFAPSLFIGAMTGGAFGMIVHELVPAMTASFEGYALVGMAAVFAGGSRAPLTAMITIFEMTGEYSIILPLMFACVISEAVCFSAMDESIYTLKLARRGVHIDPDMGSNVMKTIAVGEIMTTQVETVCEDCTTKLLQEKMLETGHMGYPVVSQDGTTLIGIVTHSDFEKVENLRNPLIPIKFIMQTNLVTLTPDNTLDEALIKMGVRDIDHFPVVDPDNPKRLVGFLTKGDVIKAYRRKRMMDADETSLFTDP